MADWTSSCCEISVSLPGPTGFEAAVQEVVRRRLAPLGEAAGDPLGNVWLGVGPAGGPQMVVAAHADQIGLIVTHVDEKGFVYFERIGGVAPLLVPGRALRDPRPRRPGARRRRAASRPTSSRWRSAARRRSSTSSSSTSAPRPRGRARARRRRRPGHLHARLRRAVARRVRHPGARRPRRGVRVVRALELYAASPGAARLTGLATVHEETTFMGAKAQALRLRPDVLDRARRRLLQRQAGGRRQGAGRRGQARRRAGARPRRRQQRAPAGARARGGRGRGHPRAGQGRTPARPAPTPTS